MLQALLFGEHLCFLLKSLFSFIFLPPPSVTLEAPSFHLSGTMTYGRLLVNLSTAVLLQYKTERLANLGELFLAFGADHAGVKTPVLLPV